MYGKTKGVHAVYMAKKVQPRFRKPQFRRTFIRQWRAHRAMTLEALAELIGSTHATLSRIERGMQPYNQELLEAIADALRTDAASLLIRDPTDPEAIWSVWDKAKPGERKIIVDIARTVVKTGT